MTAERAARLAIVVITITFVALVTSIPQSEQASRRVETDKPEYFYGEPVIVYGNVGEVDGDRTVRLVLQHTTGETILRDEDVTVNPDGSFSKVFDLAISDREGHYFVYMRYGTVVRDAEFMYYIPDNLRTYHPVQVSYELNGKLGVIYGRSTEGIEPTKLIVSAYGLDLQLDAQEDGFIDLAFPKTIIDGAGVYGISVEDYTTSYPHPFNSVTTNSTHNIVKSFVPKHAWAAHLKGTFMAANPTFAESVECEQLGIELSTCTAESIAAKRASMEDPPTPPVVAGRLLTLVASSPSSKYEAYVEWYHNDIGNPNSFSVRIVDPDQPTIALSIDYDIRIYRDDEYILPVKQVTDTDNIRDYNFVFPEQGSYTMIISVVEFNDNRERIEIPMQVTPEFPSAVVSIALASSIAAAVIVIRSRLF